MKIFVHTLEIFDTEVLICVGLKSHKELKTWIDKNGSKSIKTLFNEENYKQMDDIMVTSTGFMQEATHEKTSLTHYIMWLKEYNTKNGWYPTEVLIHEIVHLKQFLFKNKWVRDDEIEMEAYFIESAFREIRRRLVKELKIK